MGGGKSNITFVTFLKRDCNYALDPVSIIFRFVLSFTEVGFIVILEDCPF